jgi:hypothetical protein
MIIKWIIEFISLLLIFTVIAYIFEFFNFGEARDIFIGLVAGGALGRSCYNSYQ